MFRSMQVRRWARYWPDIPCSPRPLPDIDLSGRRRCHPCLAALVLAGRLVLPAWAAVASIGLSFSLESSGWRLIGGGDGGRAGKALTLTCPVVVGAPGQLPELPGTATWQRGQGRAPQPSIAAVRWPPLLGRDESGCMKKGPRIGGPDRGDQGFSIRPRSGHPCGGRRASRSRRSAAT